MKSYVKGLVVAVQFLAILTVGMMFGNSECLGQRKGGRFGETDPGNLDSCINFC